MPVQWYLLKTWVGREEELVKAFQSTVPSQMYEDCFVIKQERIWRKQQRSIIHMEPLFPGCVFLTCKEMKAGMENRANSEGLENRAALEMEPEREVFLQRLERIPAVSRLMAGGVFTLFPMTGEDGRFLERISGNEHIVRLSYVQKDEEGNICKLSEPLKVCQGQVERYQFKKRYAMVRHRLWGEERVFVLGIVLKEDRGKIARKEGSGEIAQKEESRQKLMYRGDGLR